MIHFPPDIIPPPSYLHPYVPSECRAARWAWARPADCSGGGARDVIHSAVARTDRRPNTPVRDVVAAADWAPSGEMAAGNMAAESLAAAPGGASRAAAARVGRPRSRLDRGKSGTSCLSRRNRMWTGLGRSGTWGAPGKIRFEVKIKIFLF